MKKLVLDYERRQEEEEFKGVCVFVCVCVCVVCACAHFTPLFIINPSVPHSHDSSAGTIKAVTEARTEEGSPPPPPPWWLLHPPPSGPGGTAIPAKPEIGRRRPAPPHLPDSSPTPARSHGRRWTAELGESPVVQGQAALQQTETRRPAGEVGTLYKCCYTLAMLPRAILVAPCQHRSLAWEL